MRSQALRLLMLLLTCAASAGAWAAAADDQQLAVWETRESTFTYLGFTTRYSCDGLRDQVEEALMTLGARRDLIVTPYGCTKVGGPEPAPSLQIKVSTLKPATSPAPSGAIEARWKAVSLGGVGKLGPGECELAEQIQREILPLFTTRNLKSRIDCVPHQEQAGSIELTVDVLVPAKE
jgi:hypothetical protein